MKIASSLVFLVVFWALASVYGWFVSLREPDGPAFWSWIVAATCIFLLGGFHGYRAIEAYRDRSRTSDGYPSFTFNAPTIITITNPSTREGTSARLTPEPVDEPIRGWRGYTFGVDRLTGEVLLQGSTETPWPSAHLEAECVGLYLISFKGNAQHPKARAHLESAAQCGCGIYLMRERKDVRALIVAECLAWGIAAEHERGWRVEHCRIERIFTKTTSPHVLAALRERYGAPIIHVDSMSEFLATGRSEAFTA